MNARSAMTRLFKSNEKPDVESPSDEEHGEVTHTVIYTGVVHPQSGKWRIDNRIFINRDGMRLQILLTESVFTIRATVREVEAVEDFPAFVNSLWYDCEAALRAVLDSLGFCVAGTTDVQLLSGSIDGRNVAFAIRTSMPELAIVETDIVSGSELGLYLGHAIVNPHVRHALADVRMALRLDDDSAFYCYRAIESLRQDCLGSNSEEDKAARIQSWEVLRDIIGASKAELDSVALLARSRRHGGAATLALEERRENVRRTRDYIRTYVSKLPPPPPHENLEV